MKAGGGFRIETAKKRVDNPVFGLKQAHCGTFIIGRRLFTGDKSSDIGGQFV